jgi:hypothetical protein
MQNDVMFKDCEIIREHLVQSDFIDNYFIWTKHGETQPGTESIIDERAEENMDILDDVCSHHDDRCEDDTGQDNAYHSGEGFNVDELMHNVAPDVLLQVRNKSFDNFEILDKASRDLLYEECKGCDKEHTVLWMMLELLKLNTSSRWFDTSFSALLELLTKILPKPNDLPSSTYQAKKIICPLTLGIEKINAFPSHCILYRKEHKFKDKCLRCNAGWYKRNNNSEEVEDDSNKKSKKARMKEEECHS